MFSEVGIAQEIAALFIALLALVYLVYKIGGPARTAKKAKGSAPIIGDRLARGLRSVANRRDESGPAAR